MNELSINEVFFQTIILGILSVTINKIITKRIISASLAYWFAWSFLIFSTHIALNSNWIANISTLSLYYILQLHYGAFIGFTLGSLIFPKKVNRMYYVRLIDYANIIIKKISRKVLIILFILGSIFLVERMAQVGFNLDYLSNVRAVYLERNVSLLARIGTHISVMVNILMIILAVRDSKYGVNIRLLIFSILAAAPLGLANGGRMFLLNYLLFYMGSLLLARSNFNINKSILSIKEMKSLGLLLFSLLLIFSLMGFVRGGYGESLDILYTILIWPVSTITAMDSWISMALASKDTYGLNTFSWFIDKLHKYGFLEFTEEYETMKSIMYSFEIGHNSALVIPRSIVPDLILDFGKNGVFWGMLVISFILQFITLRLVGKGIIFHALAVLALLGSFMTIQTGNIISPSVIASLFWAIVFSLFMRVKVR